ncbi:MAG: hypothetical protein WCG07_01630 [Candidatus Taylorbacteria bacterium]
MKRLTITLDPGTDTWNTDRWHRRCQQDGCREHFKVALDAITTIFHNLLHDIPCEIPAGMQGLEEILSGEEGSRREKIKKQIGNSNRMVAFVQFLVAGPWIEVAFYEGNKKKCSFSIQYEKKIQKFFCMF